jgi:hypothetical protein
VETADHATDALDVPAAFTALKVKTYEVAGLSPLTVRTPEPDWLTKPIIPPGEDVAMYLVTGAPLSEAGAVNATVIDVELAATTDVIEGASGACAHNEATGKF